MTSSIWRVSHFLLALICSVFLLIASVTGIILSGDVILEKTEHPYKSKSIDDITLAQSLDRLRRVFPEIEKITVDKNQFVTLEGTDSESNEIKAIIDPSNGNVLGKALQKSEFINQVTVLHRSLFLHDIGRFIVGVLAFLFLLISITGVILIIKRQKNLLNFFSKIKRESNAQYYHVVAGRILLIPLLLISFTGSFLFMKRFKLIPESKSSILTYKIDSLDKIDPSEFPIFKSILLKDIEKIEFPFDPDDEQDYFKILLTDRELEVNQFSGKITKETRYPYSVLIANLSLDLHTGRTNIWLALILGITSINILAFIYTGFAITFSRKSNKIKNKYLSEEAKIIIFIGSENGSTVSFADKIHQQLLDAGYLSYITIMNKYRQFPKAEHFLIFTSTYGLGDPPSNALKFLSLIEKYPQLQKIKISVIGFGSKSYSNFCGFAKRVDNDLRNKDWAEPILDLSTVNEKSPEHFANWAKEWSLKTGIFLKSTPAIYQEKVNNLQEMLVLEKTEISNTEQTFLLTLKPKNIKKITSGDLLAVYPANDYQERLYSIGRKNDTIQMKIKLHPSGLGSEYLNNLNINSIINAKIIKNRSFHFPTKAKKVVLIANGTGIAPFLGMIHENKIKTECHLYCGFRNETEMVKRHQIFAKDQIIKHKLRSFHIAFSKEQNYCYVTDLVERDANFFARILEHNGTIMICGSIIMQKDVEKMLEKILLHRNKKNLDFYKNNGQLLTDCY